MLDKYPALFPLHDFETSLRSSLQPHGKRNIPANSSDPVHLNIVSPELYILLALHCRSTSGNSFFFPCTHLFPTLFFNRVSILFHPNFHFGHSFRSALNACVYTCTSTCTFVSSLVCILFPFFKIFLMLVQRMWLDGAWQSVHCLCVPWFSSLGISLVTTKETTLVAT